MGAVAPFVFLLPLMVVGLGVVVVVRVVLLVFSFPQDLSTTITTSPKA